MNLFPELGAGVDMLRSAEFSPCGVFRYTLVRIWDPGLPRLLWGLLNPSIADAFNEDPTNRKGIKFSKAWGYGSCVFVNAFGFRSPHPKVMKAAAEPIGPDNDEWIVREAERADRIVVAWGNDGVHRGRDQDVLELLKPFDLWCLGTNKNGTPKHPLYRRDDSQLELYAQRAA